MESGSRRESSLRVMTYNILYETCRKNGGWHDRRPIITEIIRRHAPDVFGLQEVMDGQLADLRRDFPEYGVVAGERTGQSRMPFWAVTFGPVLGTTAWVLSRGDRGENRTRKAASKLLWLAAAAPVVLAVNGLIHSGSALFRGAYTPIFFRTDLFRLIEHGTICLSEPPDDPRAFLLGTWLPRLANWARLERLDGSGRVTVYNTHLDWMPWGPKSSGRILRDRMDADWDGSPQLLLGDFNGDLDCDGCRQLLIPNARRDGPPILLDAWTETPNRTGPENTCFGGVGIGPCPGRTDHIIIRKLQPERVLTVDGSARAEKASDHMPVVAELRETG